MQKTQKISKQIKIQIAKKKRKIAIAIIQEKPFRFSVHGLQDEYIIKKHSAIISCECLVYLIQRASGSF